MTEKQLRKRWHKLCEDAVALAKKKGIEDPRIFVEGGSGLCVMDGDILSQDQIVFQLGWPGVKGDCGAW
jgi:hypothetical protein